MNVYWTPYEINKSGEPNMSLAYEEPVRLEKAVPQNIKDSFYYKCPAFSQNIKNTFALYSPFEFDFSFNKTQNYFDCNNHALRTRLVINPEDDVIMQIRFVMLFIAEDSLTMTQMHPYLHHNTITDNGNVLHGEYDIGSWARPINCGISLKTPGAGNFNLKKSDVWSYIKFNTEKRVNLKRFELTPEIVNVVEQCLNLKQSKSKGIFNLKYSYDLYRRNKFNKLLVSKIKETVL